MKVEIDEYRGWVISFDTEREVFYAYSDAYDTDKDRKTYSSMKAYIDEFIKDNQDFKPIWVERPPNMWGRHEKIKLIGIRKDKRFVYENEKGERSQLSEYNEKDYILCNEKNLETYKKMGEIDDKMEKLQKEKNNLEKQIIRVELDTIKSQY
jgi:hypothetical protein